jgi:hypothetical protein
MVLLCGCKLLDPAPKVCRIATAKEELKFFLSDVVILTNTTLKYDANNEVINMEVNSSSSNRRATFSLNISKLANAEKVYEYRYSDGSISRDTLKFNEKGYRIQLRRGLTRGIQTIFEYAFDADGYPAGIKQVDQFGKVYSEAKWIVEKGNLAKYQVLRDGIFVDTEIYTYDIKKENDRIYYINNYQNSYTFGRAPKRILLKVVRNAGTGSEALYEYGEYKYDANGNVTEYIENITPSLDIPSIRKVTLTYTSCL